MRKKFNRDVSGCMLWKKGFAWSSVVPSYHEEVRFPILFFNKTMTTAREEWMMSYSNNETSTYSSLYMDTSHNSWMK